MKTNSLIQIGIALLFVTACSKENEEFDIQKKITGKWDWIESYGGFTGTAHYTTENTGDERSLVFLDNNTTYVILNNDTINETDYFISKEESRLLGEEFDFLTINYKYPLADTVIFLPVRYILRNLSDVLVMDEDVVDGFGHKYKRVKSTGSLSFSPGGAHSVISGNKPHSLIQN